LQIASGGVIHCDCLIYIANGDTKPCC